MLFSVITPNYNGGRFLENTLRSIIGQKSADIDLELIVVDGKSTDNSLEIIDIYSDEIAKLIIEKDTGPANAINKGLSIATGDIISWLNADDFYYPGALQRVHDVFNHNKEISVCFGRCSIVDTNNHEIRKIITHFKEFFFPFSSRFTIQCINYVSQPALFFKKEASVEAGKLREDMVAAWDYDYLLRLWTISQVDVIPGGYISAFRWYDESISGRNFKIQFKEELEAAKIDAGKFSPQVLIHHGVRWGIVCAYYMMSILRMSKKKNIISA